MALPSCWPRELAMPRGRPGLKKASIIIKTSRSPYGGEALEDHHHRHHHHHHHHRRRHHHHYHYIMFMVIMIVILSALVSDPVFIVVFGTAIARAVRSTRSGADPTSVSPFQPHLWKRWRRRLQAAAPPFPEDEAGTGSLRSDRRQTWCDGLPAARPHLIIMVSGRSERSAETCTNNIPE